MRSGVPSSPFFTRCASQTFSARVRGRASDVRVGGCCVHAFASSGSAVSRRRTPRRDRPRTRPRRGTEEEVVEHAPLQATPSSTALDPVARRTRRAAGSARSGPRRPVRDRVRGSRPSGVSTRVPLVECRSVTTTRPSTTSTSAWVFDTDRAGSASVIVAASRSAGIGGGIAPEQHGTQQQDLESAGCAQPPSTGLRRVAVGASMRSTGGSGSAASADGPVGGAGVGGRRRSDAGRRRERGQRARRRRRGRCGRARRSVAAPPGSTRAAGR